MSYCYINQMIIVSMPGIVCFYVILLIRVTSSGHMVMCLYGACAHICIFNYCFLCWPEAPFALIEMQ